MRIAIIVGILLLPSLTLAQLSDRQITVLNEYVAYMNESSHILKEIRRPLEAFNLHLNRAYRRNVKSNYATQFSADNIYENQRFFIDDLCIREEGSDNPVENLNFIYQRIVLDSEVLPQPIEDSLLVQLEAVQEVMHELIKEMDQLGQQTSDKAYLKEAHFQSSYELLLRCQDLFYYYTSLTAALYEDIRRMYGPYPEELSELITAYDLNRELLHAIGRDERQQVVSFLGSYEKAQELLRSTAEVFLANEQGFNYHHAETFSFLNKQLGKIAALARAYVAQQNPMDDPKVADIFSYESYGNACYYYNEILGKHNYHYVGYTYFLNRSLLHPSMLLLDFPEEPYWYEVLIPGGHPLVGRSTLGSPPPTAKTPMAGAPAANLIFLLDVSGSMKRYNKMPLLKQAFMDLLDLMRPEDQLAIVTYSGEAEIVLRPTSSIFRNKIIHAIEALDGSGKTRAPKGLKMAYRLAESSFIPGGTNRIILATDGDLEGAYNMKKLINQYVEKGISLSVFYFPDAGNSAALKIRLQRLAQTTHGNFRQVHEGNVHEVLLEEARGLKIQ